MLNQNEICDVIQRWIGKTSSGKYRFPAEIVYSIRDETGINAQLINACLVQNGYLAQ